MLMGDVRRNRWIVIYIPVCLVIMVGIEGLDGGTVLQNDKLKIRSCNGIKFPSGPRQLCRLCSLWGFTSFMTCILKPPIWERQDAEESDYQVSLPPLKSRPSPPLSIRVISSTTSRTSHVQLSPQLD